MNKRSEFDYLGFLPMIERLRPYKVTNVDCQDELFAMLKAECNVIGKKVVATISHYDEGWGEQFFTMPLILCSQKICSIKNPPWGNEIRWELQGEVMGDFGKKHLFRMLFGEHESFIKDVTDHGPGLTEIVQRIIHNEHEEPMEG